jgi:hypothetical protein
VVNATFFKTQVLCILDLSKNAEVSMVKKNRFIRQVGALLVLAPLALLPCACTGETTRAANYE